MREAENAPVEIGLALFQAYPPAQFIQLVQRIEQYGYKQLWIGSERFYRDPTVQLTLAATHTTQIDLGTFVADPYTEHPALIAARIATLDELSRQRARLMLGAGGTALARMGIERVKPLKGLREAVAIIRGLLRGESVEFKGQVLSVHGARLAFSARPDISIGIATRGAKMLELAGEIADSVMISTFATPAGIDYAQARIQAGAQRAGRTANALDLISRVDVCLHSDRAIARQVVSRFLCRSLAASYPDRSWVEAVGLTIPLELDRVFAQRNGERAQEVADQLPASMVDHFGWAGTAEEIANKMKAIAARGIWKFAMVPHLAPGQTMDAFIEEFRHVMN